MEITTELVDHLAELSRLEFTAEEIENFKHEFAQTIERIEKLENANLQTEDNVQCALDAEQELKQDVQGESLKKDEVIKNAPDTMGSSIAVPMMVE